jgi:hypothetical protein
MREGMKNRELKSRFVDTPGRTCPQPDTVSTLASHEVALAA